MKNSVLTVTLLGLISFGASAAQYNHHDDNISDRYSKELRLNAFEGETRYQVNVNPLLSVDRDDSVSTRRATELRKQALGEPVRSVESFAQRDRDESVSTLRATELRLKAFEGHSFTMAQVSQTGGYDFSYDSVVDDAKSHYRNHR